MLHTVTSHNLVGTNVAVARVITFERDLFPRKEVIAPLRCADVWSGSREPAEEARAAITEAGFWSGGVDAGTSRQLFYSLYSSPAICPCQHSLVHVTVNYSRRQTGYADVLPRSTLDYLVW